MITKTEMMEHAISSKQVGDSEAELEVYICCLLDLDMADEAFAEEMRKAYRAAEVQAE